MDSSQPQGHVNVYGSPALVSHEQPDTSDAEGLLSWLAAQPGAFAQLNHPGLGGSFLTEQPANGAALVLQEVGNGNGSSKPYRLFEAELLQAWANGWRLAPTIGSDTHDCLWGYDTLTRTGIWTTGLTSSEALEALRGGRVFATEDPDLAIGWICGEVWMVAAVPSKDIGACRGYYWDGQAEPAAVVALDFSGQELWRQSVDSGDEFPVNWPQGISAMWLKVAQLDGQRAWAAPVWLDSSGGK